MRRRRSLREDFDTAEEVVLSCDPTVVEGAAHVRLVRNPDGSLTMEAGSPRKQVCDRPRGDGQIQGVGVYANGINNPSVRDFIERERSKRLGPCSLPHAHGVCPRMLFESTPRRERAPSSKFSPRSFRRKVNRTITESFASVTDGSMRV